MEDALERVNAAVSSQAPGAGGGVECCIACGIREVDQDTAWIVEKPYDLASGEVGGLLDITKPPRAIEGVIPNGGSDEQRGGH